MKMFDASCYACKTQNYILKFLMIWVPKGFIHEMFEVFFSAAGLFKVMSLKETQI